MNFPRNLLLLVCLLLVGAPVQASPTARQVVDTMTVFSFSQGETAGALDTQIVHVAPEMNIRTWNAWKGLGAKVSDFNLGQVSALHNAGIGFNGGLTATVIFREDAPSDSAFLDWSSCDAHGDTVSYDQIVPGARRGNLGSPGFRAHLVDLARVQIDAGVDGLFFDEVNSGFDGSETWGWNGNEGFDDYHLKAFNRYLIGRYPGWTKAQFVAQFKMDSTNALDPNLPPDDLERNFNFRKYLVAKGWSDAPLTTKNPLATIWGKVVQNRMKLVAGNFLDGVTTTWWKEVVDSVRAYGRSRGREIQITSNGIIPYVDFNCVGLYDFNKDSSGRQIDYVPVQNGKLDGAHSLQWAFRNLRNLSAQTSDSASVVLFLDWPTSFMNSYYAFSARQKLDYWKIYGAEAYANGLFWAFHLRTAMWGDPTAQESGILDSLRSTMAFYRNHADLYHHLSWPASTVQAGSGIATSVSWQADRNRLLIHLVNHNYADSILPQRNPVVTIPMDSAPVAVQVVSPDFVGSRVPLSSWKDGVLSVTLDSLGSYSVLEIECRAGFHPQGISMRRAVAKGRPISGLERIDGHLRWQGKERDVRGRKP